MYKNFQSTIKDVDQKGRVLVAANAIGNIDSDNDISMPGSFQKTIKENFDRLKWFLNHNRDFLVGVPLEAKEMMPYVEVLGQINISKQLGKDVYSDYQLYAEHGKTLEHSVGVDPVKKDVGKDGVRRVSEWKWWEFSTLYSWGANDQTPLIAFKENNNFVEIIDWLELKMRKGNYSDEKFKQIEAQIKSLRSLIAEPGQSTQVDEPNYISVIDSFINKLKTA